MKQIRIWLLTAAAVSVLTACTSQPAAELPAAADSPSAEKTDFSAMETIIPTEENIGNPLETVPGERESGGGTLVAYFSATGTTRQVAEWIAGQTGADLYEIIPEIPYSSVDLDYNDPTSRTTLEQEDPAARPAISGRAEHMETYDTVFLGYPVWHGQAPKIVRTFLESYDFGGKTIILFCTSHSSDIGSSGINLHDLCPDTVTWTEGERFPAETTEKTVAEWLEGLPVRVDGTSAAFSGPVRIIMTFDGGQALMELADNSAARSLLAQLPLTLTFEDFAGAEKISYPPKELDFSDTPDGHTPGKGDVDCFVPWGNLAIFYQEDTGSYSADLVPLGRIIQGIEQLAMQEDTFDVRLELRN